MLNYLIQEKIKQKIVLKKMMSLEYFIKNFLS